MKADIEQFLTDEQRKSLESEVLRVKQRLGKMPRTTNFILSHLTQLKSPVLQEFKEIDPENTLFLQKIINLNCQAFYYQFGSIVTKIIDVLIDQKAKMQRREQLRNLEFQIQSIVNQVCQTEQFYLAQEISNQISQELSNGSFGEFTFVLTRIIGFMYKVYEIQLDRVKRQHAVTRGLENIREAMLIQIKKKGQIQSKIEESMNNRRKQSQIHGDFQQNDEYLKLFAFCDQVEQETEKQQEKQVILAQQLYNQPNGPQKSGVFSKGFNLIANIKKKSAKILKKVDNFVNKKSAYQQKQINEMAQYEQMSAFLQNLQNHPYFQLKQSDITQINKISQINSIQELKQLLQESFTESQMAVFKFCIENMVHLWIEDQNCYDEESQIFIKYYSFLIDYLERLQLSLEKIRRGNKSNSNLRYFILVKYFLKTLEELYMPFTKRYLMNVLSKIQNQLDLKQKLYLRGALRIYEQKFIQPTKLASLLANQRPLRSQDFEQSLASKLYIQNQKFEDKEKVRIQFQKTLKEIQIQNNLQESSILQFARLGCANQTKTVTILISGFLSENSSKDLQWMGMIRALRDTELYCLGWRSSTLKQLADCLSKMGQDIIFNPINLSGAPWMIAANVARYAYKMYGNYKSNPFSQACNRAQLTGIYLAQLLIAHFSDRFINLVGFSLGSQVVAACAKRLIQKNRLSLLNRIVTIGGVADQQKVQDILRRSNISLNWINIWSKKDTAVRFLYRLTNLSEVPIGSSQFQGHSGHQFTCLQSNFVTGHMDFRSHLYGFGLLTGLNHD